MARGDALPGRRTFPVLRRKVFAEVKDRNAAVDSVIRVAAIYSLNFADMGRSVQQFGWWANYRSYK